MTPIKMHFQPSFFQRYESSSFSTRLDFLLNTTRTRINEKRLYVVMKIIFGKTEKNQREEMTEGAELMRLNLVKR